MVLLRQQPWWQADRSDRWHTFGCGKSLLSWQRARFSPSCSKCELILYAFHSEGETGNRSLEELRGRLFKRGVTSVVCVCLSLCVDVYSYTICTCMCTCNPYVKPYPLQYSQSSTNRARSRLILSQVAVYRPLMINVNAGTVALYLVGPKHIKYHSTCIISICGAFVSTCMLWISGSQMFLLVSQYYEAILSSQPLVIGCMSMICKQFKQ